MRRHSEKRWYGKPPVCDVCGHPPLDYFVDGKVSWEWREPIWGLFCQDCWQEHGDGKLGTGYGQAYAAEPPYYALTDEPKLPL